MKTKTIRQIIGGAGAVGTGTALGLGLESATASPELKIAPKKIHKVDKYGTPYLAKSPEAKKRTNRKLLASLGTSAAIAPFAIKGVPKLIRNRALSGITKETKSFNTFANKSLGALKDTKDSLSRIIADAQKRGDMKDIREATKRLAKVDADIVKVEGIIRSAPKAIKEVRNKSILGGGGASKRLKKNLAEVFGSNKTMFGEENIVSSKMDLDRNSMRKIYQMRLEKTLPRDLV